MSYHRKVIFISLGLLAAVTLLSFLGELGSPGKPDALMVGLWALGFSLLEALTLLILAVIARVGVFGRAEDQVLSPEGILDASGPVNRPLTPGRRAAAFLAAAGLVLLVGGSLCYGSMTVGTFNVH